MKGCQVGALKNKKNKSIMIQQNDVTATLVIVHDDPALS